ncbi:MAG TPA: caspase family protein [Kofleriaceae bacterium]
MKRLAPLLVVAALASTARAETRRVAVIVGNNAGNDATERLRYAEDDATKVARVLSELGGVAPTDLFVVTGGNRERLDVALRDAAARIATYRASGHDRVVVIFYYSGHSDGLALELGRDRLEFSALRRWLADTSADVRLAFVDACKSGALVAAKGGSPGPAFQIRLTDDLASTGEALLTSSAATEDALESQEIGGSFFTHHLVSGLRGAADASGDHQVTLGEAYRYAYAHTITTSGATIAGPQHPVYDYRISGQGEVVLTELAHPTAALAFPSAIDRALVIEAAHGEVIAEVGTGSTSLAVLPGAYTIRAWRGDKVVEGKVTVVAKQTRTVAWAELSPIVLSRPQAKGDVRARTERDADPLAISAEFGVRTALTREVGILTGARVGVDELSPSGLGLSVEVARGADVTIHETTLFIAGNYHWGTDRGAFSARAGLAMGAGVVMQEAAVSGWSGAFEAGPFAGVDLALTHSLALGLHAELNAVVAKIDGQASLLPVLSGWFGARLAL